MLSIQKEISYLLLGDIKDGLLKMILFTNLEEVKINNKKVPHIPVLKLTTGDKFSIETASSSEKQLLNILKTEARANNFKVMINKDFL